MQLPPLIDAPAGCNGGERILLTPVSGRAGDQPNFPGYIH